MNEILCGTATYYEARIYIGSRQRYNGPEFSEDDLVAVIGDFQTRLYKLWSDKSISTPVRITKTRYVFGDYSEVGWEIGILNYPRKPNLPNELREFALELAKLLLVKFNQNRISVVCKGNNFLSPDFEIVMFYADDAEESHK